MCQDGYCQAGSTFQVCRAQVGTCNILPCSWSHGGALATECINGVCLCHTGYHNNGNGVCANGWWAPAELLAMNETQRLSALAYNEPTDEDALKKYTAAFAEHVPILISALIVSGLACGALQRVRRTPVVGVEEESLYAALPEAEATARHTAA